MITVLANDLVRNFIPKRTKIHIESHGRISFNLSEKAFLQLQADLRLMGFNPFAVMAWE